MATQGEIAQAKYDSANLADRQTMATKLAGEKISEDFLAAQTTSTYLTPMTASGQVKGTPGYFKGMFVSAASDTPTIKVWDSLTATGQVLVDTFTPVAGTMYIFPCPRAAIGIYITISGTVTLTPFYD